MTEQEFLKDFFEVAQLKLIGSSFSLKTALEVFAVREDMRKQLKADKEKQWEKNRQLGYRFGFIEGEAKAKQEAITIEELRNYTVNDLLQMIADRNNEDK